MSRYDAAMRIARAVHANGWGCLSMSEESVLQSDDEFNRMVMSLIQKLNRQSILNGGDRASEIHNDKTYSVIFDWECSEIARRVELWVHKINRTMVMEIKEWSISDYHHATITGAHELILQRNLEYKNRKDLTKMVVETLTHYECPKETITKVIKEI